MFEVDNFYVRSFAGREAYLRPLGSVSEADLSKAKQVLGETFEVVLILERFDRDLVQLEVRSSFDVWHDGPRRLSHPPFFMWPAGVSRLEDHGSGAR